MIASMRLIADTFQRLQSVLLFAQMPSTAWQMPQQPWGWELGSSTAGQLYDSAQVVRIDEGSYGFIECFGTRSALFLFTQRTLTT